MAGIRIPVPPRHVQDYQNKRSPVHASSFNMMFVVLGLMLGLLMSHSAYAFPVGNQAWSDAQWQQHCRDVRTSYNPDTPLSNTRLTLAPQDPRFTDFLFWVWANKITEHQVEQLGGTEWDGPTDGVIFHWAPGSRWETHTVAPFSDAIHHLVSEHHWTDKMFPEFFGPYGQPKGAAISSRLSHDQAPTWEMFLKHIGGPDSPYYRYVFHQESVIDPRRRRILMVGGQGVAFEYTYDRYLHEIEAVLTDCKAYQFFQLYDLHGKGFASTPGWAGQPFPYSAIDAYGHDH